MMKMVAILVALAGVPIEVAGPPKDEAFDPALIQAFTAVWQKFPPLRAAPHGLARMNMAGLHAMMTRSEHLPRDDIAETRIREALANSGIAFLPTDRFLVRCRHDVCETLFVDHRPFHQRVDSGEPDRLSRLTVAVDGACRSTHGYPASVVTGLPGRFSAFSFFCIDNPDVEK